MQRQRGELPTPKSRDDVRIASQNASQRLCEGEGFLRAKWKIGTNVAGPAACFAVTIKSGVVRLVAAIHRNHGTAVSGVEHPSATWAVVNFFNSRHASTVSPTVDIPFGIS